MEGKEYPTRLFQLKGRRNVRIKQVEASAASLNDGDVFILDLGLDIYQWNGSSASRQEKAKALSTCTLLRDDRGAKPKIHVIESSEEAAGERGSSFWEALGGYPDGGVASAEAGGDDHEEERKAKQELNLYVVSDVSGAMKTELVASSKLKRDMLKREDTFILDTGTSAFVWVGKGASREEKSQAFLVANNFLLEQKRPSWTQVSLILDGGETPEFKSYFFVWQPPAKPRDWSQPPSSGIAKAVEQKEIDVGSLVKERKQSDSMNVDDGSGTTKVWRIEDMDKVEVPEDKFGQFYSGDSYIVLYTYRPPGKSRDAYIIYFWQGRNSTADEKGASALLATKMDDDLGGSPVQVRVVQGKEPSHFCSLFKGEMVIHDGGKASGFKNSAQVDEADDDGVSLFHIRGTNNQNTHAVQIAEVTASLNSGDCFVLLIEGKIFSWNGAGSNESEKETSLKVANRLSNWNADTARDVVTLAEGEEPDDFWAALGGKGEYSSSTALRDQPREPRLFSCSNITGALEVEEVFNYAQDDLLQDDVMILDVFNSVFIWVGSGANSKEKKMANDVARKYVSAAAEIDGRDPATNIITIHAGSEPPMFTCHFLGWDAKAAEVFVDPYEKRMKELKSKASFSQKPSWAKKAIPDGAAGGSGGESKDPEPKSAPAASVEPPAAPAVTTSAANSVPSDAEPVEGTFTYAQLKGNPCEVQDQIMPSRKEQYLSSSEFQEVFKMDKTAFEKLAGWKRKKAKVAAGLF